MQILVTGGAGFIGSALIRHMLRTTAASVVNVDKLSYASSLESLSLAAHEQPGRYAFAQVDICNRNALSQVFAVYQPDCVFHLAAESHVDRSIDSPEAFIQTNVVGTYSLLEVARAYWRGIGPERQREFRFYHVSTDEVYGDLADGEAPFTETTPYAPSSPYAASKASSDHLVRAWARTYGLPAIITNCSNNYGPFQFPEKLIPLTILNALEGKPLPVYGQGTQVRDWLYVEDHARALHAVALRGVPGQTYNIGGCNEVQNITVVRSICGLLEELAPAKPPGVKRYEDLIEFVTDRPGHDRRYAIDPRKARAELDWAPQETFASGLRKTVAWYLQHSMWCKRVLNGRYAGERLGILA